MRVQLQNSSTLDNTKKLKHKNHKDRLEATAALSIKLSIDMEEVDIFRRPQVIKDWYFLYVRLGEDGKWALNRSLEIAEVS